MVIEPNQNRKEFMKVLNPNNLPTASINEFNATQGELKFLSKANYDKLKGNIERRGFDLPVTAWIAKDGKKWLVDGHQRMHVLQTEGWSEPIPYLEIKAASLTEASERLLEITSQYGTITQEGLDEFIAKFELPEVDVLNRTNFDGIFDFSIEQPQEEEEEDLEVETPKGMSLKINIAFNGEQYMVKTVDGKKTSTLGSYDDLDSLKEEVIDFVMNYEES